MNWKLWFVQLSGWPALLAMIATVAIFMLALSVVLPRLANRSALQNAVLAAVVMLLLVFVVLGLIAAFTRS